MPSAREANHLQLANKNHDAMVHLMSDPQKYAEWIATTAYYKAAQVVEAVLASRGKKSSSHGERLHSIKKIGRHELHAHLRIMWGISSVARYLFDHTTGTGYNSFHDLIKPEDVIEQVVKKRLRPIEQMCLAMLPKESRDMLTQTPR
jgi:hypothetical protein